MNLRVSIYCTIRTCAIYSVPDTRLNDIAVGTLAIGNMNEAITNNTTDLGIVLDFILLSSKASAKYLTVDITTCDIYICTRISFGWLYAIINLFILTNIGNITTTIYISKYLRSTSHGNTCVSKNTGDVLVCGIRSTNTLTTTIYVTIHLTALYAKRGIFINDSSILLVIHSSITTTIHASKDRHSLNRGRGIMFNFTCE